MNRNDRKHLPCLIVPALDQVAIGGQRGVPVIRMNDVGIPVDVARQLERGIEKNAYFSASSLLLEE
jgi:hypothetical protein